MSIEIDLYVLVEAQDPRVIDPFRDRFEALAPEGSGHEMSASPGGGLLRFGGRDLNPGLLGAWESLEGPLLRSGADTVIRAVWDDSSVTWRVRAKRAGQRFLASWDRSHPVYREMEETRDRPALVAQLIDAGRVSPDEDVLGLKPDKLDAYALDLAFGPGFEPNRLLPFLLLVYGDLVERARLFDSPEAVDMNAVSLAVKQLVADEAAELSAYALVYDALVDIDGTRQDAAMVLYDAKGTGRRRLLYRRYDPASGRVIDAEPQPYREAESLFPAP